MVVFFSPGNNAFSSFSIRHQHKIHLFMVQKSLVSPVFQFKVFLSCFFEKAQGIQFSIMLWIFLQLCIHLTLLFLTSSSDTGQTELIQNRVQLVSLLYQAKRAWNWTNLHIVSMAFISFWSSAPAKVELLGGCRKRDPCHLSRQFFVFVQCTPAQRRLHKPRWHCCPYSQLPPGTEVARKTSSEVDEQLHIGLLGSYVSLLRRMMRPQERPSHLMGEPLQCRLTESQLHWRTLLPAWQRPTAGLWKEVKWPSQSWPPVGALNWQNQEDDIQFHTCHQKFSVCCCCC